MEPKATVTGGAGFIGSSLVRALLANGYRVSVLDDFSTGRLSNLQGSLEQIELREGSILEPTSLRQVMAGSDVVFHYAAQVSVPFSMANPERTQQINGTGTLNVLEAAVAAGCRRVIYAGSSSCYGDVARDIQTESDPIAPISPYGESKYQGEVHCHRFATETELETVVLRYFNVFGPGQDPDSPYSAVIPKFISLILAGQSPTIFGDGQQSRDFTFVENVVQANLLAARAHQLSGHSINIANGRSISLRQLVALLSEYTAESVEPVFEAARAGDILHSCANISKARELLEYQPLVSIEEGLKRTVDFFRSRSL